MKVIALNGLNGDDLCDWFLTAKLLRKVSRVVEGNEPKVSQQ